MLQNQMLFLSDVTFCNITYSNRHFAPNQQYKIRKQTEMKEGEEEQLQPNARINTSRIQSAVQESSRLYSVQENPAVTQRSCSSLHLGNTILLWQHLNTHCSHHNHCKEEAVQCHQSMKAPQTH